MKCSLQTLLLIPILGLFLCTAQVSLAQSSTTGAISGLVVAQEDAVGRGWPGVQIVAVHEPTGSRANGVTRSDGRFVLPNLRVGGPYQVTASLDGFRDRAATGVFVKLGETAHLSFQLQLATIEETLVVVGESTLINPSRTRLDVERPSRGARDPAHHQPRARGLRPHQSLLHQQRRERRRRSDLGGRPQQPL